jgi:hypothetical protein
MTSSVSAAVAVSRSRKSFDFVKLSELFRFACVELGCVRYSAKFVKLTCELTSCLIYVARAVLLEVYIKLT